MSVWINREALCEVLSNHMVEEDKNGKILLSDIADSVLSLPSVTLCENRTKPMHQYCDDCKADTKRCCGCVGLSHYETKAKQI